MEERRREGNPFSIGEMPEKALVKEDTFWSGRIRHAFELFQGERFVMR
jgi:hypothetical protein